MADDNKQGVVGLIAESTKETRNTLDKRVAGGVNKFFDLLGATPVARKMSLYIEEAPYKLEQSRKKMQEKYEQIPVENRVEPNPRIALNVANEFNYCLDEEHIKEMFTNILISDMDKTKKSNVLPSFIEIVKQLSKADAEFLKFFKDNKMIEDLPVIMLRYDFNSGGYVEVSNNIVISRDKKVYPINPVVLDNLIRLRIVEIPHGVFLKSFKGYEEAFDKVKVLPEFSVVPPDATLSFEKKKLCFTKYGKKFINICLS